MRKNKTKICPICENSILKYITKNRENCKFTKGAVPVYHKRHLEATALGSDEAVSLFEHSSFKTALDILLNKSKAAITKKPANETKIIKSSDGLEETLPIYAYEHRSPTTAFSLIIFFCISKYMKNNQNQIYLVSFALAHRGSVARSMNEFLNS